MTPLRGGLAALGLAALLAGAWWVYELGHERAEARFAADQAALRAQLEAARDEADKAARKIIETGRARDALAAELEALANEDPGRDRISLPADSVRRIDSR